MTRVHVIVEGQTEESFIKNLLATKMWPRELYLTAILLGVPGHKGGRPKYVRLKRDVVTQLKQDKTAYCTTMLDFYGLGQDFPGMSLPESASSREKVRHLEQAMRHDICAQIPELRPEVRFVPYIQLHEYESLLFSDPAALARALNQPELLPIFQAVRSACATPEDINDAPGTAPSKRIARLRQSYKKVVEGTLAAIEVGIDAMRSECPHFREWLERLEQLPPL